MRVLAIETSCDETAVAIYDSEKGLLSDKLFSQVDLHHIYRGVVPELAARDHLQRAFPMVLEAMHDVGNAKPDGVAYTAGPGLSGGLLVGASLARSLAFGWSCPAVAIHHMEGHLLAPMLSDTPPTFPFLALLVSGGHTLLVQVLGIGQYTILGESVDDAVGEAFDKTARVLGLGYPGGPALAKLALQGDPKRFVFPRPMRHSGDCNFSFSGLKTHALQTFKKSDQSMQTKADIACAFEQAAVDILCIKTLQAMQATGLQRIVIAGGVGANLHLRQRLTHAAEKYGYTVFYPSIAYCTDNAAMIAYAGCQRLMAGERTGLEIKIRSRWPLTDLSRPLPHDTTA